MTMNQDVQYIFPRKCYFQYSGHGVQLDCGRNDEVAKKSVEDLLGSPNTFSYSLFTNSVCCVLNPLKALLTTLSNSQVVVGRCGSGGNLDCPGSTSHGNLCCEVDVLQEF